MSEKYDVILRHKADISDSDRTYFSSRATAFKSIIPVRNSVMHARPLTIDEYSRGFAFAQNLLKSKSYWPVLAENYFRFSKDPSSFTSKSIEFLDDPIAEAVLHNLPTPEHDDTGFLPRPDLERELKKRILGRHPVVTILGEGGNGKTALALQTLYGLVATNDHPFDAIIWVSAKTSVLTAEGVKRIGDEVVEAMSLLEEAASFEPGLDSPIERLHRLLAANKILLAIDNLETVQGNEIKKLSEDVPGESKILLTSRVPLGGDLSVNVGELSDKDGLIYIRRLTEAYEVRSLRQLNDENLRFYIGRLHHKPLLIKWFVLGVKSGADPQRIIANPKDALKFCLENVVGKLSSSSKTTLVAMATIPNPLSAQIVDCITDLNPQEIEAALNELNRFGLVEFSDSQGSEQRYKLRSFARSYAMRVIAPPVDLSTKIRESYNRIESQFNYAKGQTNYNPYSLKNFKIRSTAEMLASQKLKQAVHLAMSNDFARAHEIIEDLRIINPAYFEVYRAEAYISYLNNDVVGACAAYESAIELAPDEPQLHFFYACMLMRGVDIDLANEHFAKVHEIDPTSMAGAREYARSCLQRFDFPQARKMLTHAATLDFKNDKDRTVYTDLEIQYHVRLISHKISVSDWSEIHNIVKNLALFVYSLDLAVFDERMAYHLMEVLPHLKRIESSGKVSLDYTSDLEEWIDKRFVQKKGWNVLPGSRGFQKSGAAIGALKQAGLRETFGFLKADDGRETFVHEDDAGSELWKSMIAGARVCYEIVFNQDGRTCAINLSRA